MEQFDLKMFTRQFLLGFDQACLNGTNAILEWFYKIINYDLVFETYVQATNLYNKLSSYGFTDQLDIKDEVACFKKLMQKEDDYEQRVGYYIIALIMCSLKENKPLNETLKQFICLYNEIYNKKSTYEYMMESLRDAVNTDVVFTLMRYGKPELKTGKLEKVEDYHSVTINGEVYSFVGVYSEINKITDSYGKVLYNNSRADGVLQDSSAIEKKKETLFGENYNKLIKLVC